MKKNICSMACIFSMALFAIECGTTQNVAGKRTEEKLSKADQGETESGTLGTGNTAGGSAATCKTSVGSGTLNGAVQGNEIEVIYAMGAEVLVYGIRSYFVGFSMQGGSCSELITSTDTMPVYIFLCDNKPGDYEVGELCVTEDGKSFINSVKINKEEKDIGADGGIITVETFEPACGGKVRGSFTANFAGEIITGTFDTVSCGLPPE
jgi:hypothetical protein